MAFLITSFPVLSAFEGLVLYTAQPYRVFVLPLASKSAITTQLNEMNELYEIKGQGEHLQEYEAGQICAVRRIDGNWYRALISDRDSAAARIQVFYIDYGITEEVKRDDIRDLDNKFYDNRSGYAIEVNLPLTRPSNDPAKLQKRLNELLVGQMVTVKPLELRPNQLFGDVIIGNNDSVAEMVKAEGLISTWDYIRGEMDYEDGEPEPKKPRFDSSF